MNSYVNHKRFGVEFLPDYTKKIDDLYNVYSFAKENTLNEKNISEDLEYLMSEELSFSEVFYFASMIHLVFVKIHPWNDGNGRSARLLEKWFLSEKLGEKAWFVQSEKNYYQRHKLYYSNLRSLGLEYEILDYSMALPFLEMLLQSLFL